MSARELIVLGTSSQVPTRFRNHNGYLVRWDDPNNAFTRTTKLELIHCINGLCALVKSTDAPLAGAGYTTLEVRVRYAAIDVYIAGTLKLSTITNGGDIGPGVIGAYAFAGANATRLDSLAINQP